MTTLRRFDLVPIPALALAGCAALGSPSFAPGTSMSQVESRMGKAPYVVKAPDGDTVWQFPSGPIGQTTYIVRFGPDQRTKSVYQALTLAEFAKIRIGMTRDDIRLLLGPPGETSTFSRMNEVIWSYHYQASASLNRIFNVHFDARTGYVRGTSDQPDVLLNPIDPGTGNS